jgi:hypothetical protein
MDGPKRVEANREPINRSVTVVASVTNRLGLAVRVGTQSAREYPPTPGAAGDATAIEHVLTSGNVSNALASDRRQKARCIP